MDDVNPYRSPSAVTEVPPLNGGAASDLRSWSRGRIALAVIAAIVHSYFFAMLTSWSWDWVTGKTIPTRPREYGMYTCAIVCLVCSAVMLYGIVRNRPQTAIVSMLLCLFFFGALVVFDSLT